MDKIGNNRMKIVRMAMALPIVIAVAVIAAVLLKLDTAAITLLAGLFSGATVYTLSVINKALDKDDNNESTG